jgi:beta-glucosidase
VRPGRQRFLLFAAGFAALTSLGAPQGIGAGSGPPVSASADVEHRIDALMARMTVDEKLGQLQQQVPQAPGVLEAQAAAGKLGAVLDLVGAHDINALQHVAVDRSRLHIPLIFGLDTIHGYRTIFPLPLGEASSFDPRVAQTDASVGADESAHNGIKQVFAPMIDVTHDPRWGRVAEGAGEDPFLGSAFAAARVAGSQGSDVSNMSDESKVIATAKHFVAYGQPEGGRDYNTADMSLQRLWNLYLPPFKAAVDAGIGSVMSAFDPLSGVPASANHYTETQVLKDQWGFSGFIDSDYTSVQELILHGFAADGCDAARLALNAGTDMEMVSTNYVDCGKQLLAQNLISMQTIDNAVRRILRIKFEAGLFDNPYVEESQVAAHTLTAADRAAARAAAVESMVLLKNSGNALPLSTGLHQIAVVGPLGDKRDAQSADAGFQDVLGTPGIGAQGQSADAVSIFAGIKNAVPGATVTYTPGCRFVATPPGNGQGGETCTSSDNFKAAKAAATAAQMTVVVVGEPAQMSGEAESRSTLDMPGVQQQLVDAIKGTNKPFVVVLMNGRPLAVPDLDAAAPALLEAWYPGIEGGNAVADILFGQKNPGGKLPITFPHDLGQVPIYYNHENTGRPPDPGNKYTSKYNDGPFTPLYEFGYGLSYTTFQISAPRLSSVQMQANGTITVSADVRNIGPRTGDEVVQLYLHDPVASIVQPVRRLRGFDRVTLRPGESNTVTFTLGAPDVGFYDNSGKFRVEPGRIDTYVGDSSGATGTASFTVVGGQQQP